MTSSCLKESFSRKWSLSIGSCLLYSCSSSCNTCSTREPCSSVSTSSHFSPSMHSSINHSFKLASEFSSGVSHGAPWFLSFCSPKHPVGSFIKAIITLECNADSLSWCLFQWENGWVPLSLLLACLEID